MTDVENVMLAAVSGRLNEERLRLGKSKAAFARDLNMTTEGWRNIGRGLSNFKVGVVARAAQAGVDIQYIVTGVRSINAPVP